MCVGMSIACMQMYCAPAQQTQIMMLGTASHTLRTVLQLTSCPLAALVTYIVCMLLSSGLALLLPSMLSVTQHTHAEVQKRAHPGNNCRHSTVHATSLPLSSDKQVPGMQQSTPTRTCRVTESAHAYTEPSLQTMHTLGSAGLSEGA